MEYTRATNRNFYLALYLLISFHLIGVFGLCVEDCRPWFSAFTPVTLLLSALIVFLFHEKEGGPLSLFIITAGVLGFFVEVLGVATTWPFGEYYYGDALGVQALQVPLVIGINWALLVYCTAVIAAKISDTVWVRVLTGAALMVLIDVPIEQVAPVLDYWYWVGGSIPALNFVGWFVTAAVLQALCIKLLHNFKNHMAVIYYLIVLVFFTTLNIFV